VKAREIGQGNGESIVFLHGGNVAGWMWEAQTPAFTDYHLLVPDLPGFGDSNDERWGSVSDAADSVARMIADRAGNGVAHVVGLSLGSSVAVRLAQRHPQLVTSLLLSSTSVARPSRATVALSRAMLGAWNQRWFWRAQAVAYRLPADAVQLFVDTGLGIRKETVESIFHETCAGFTADELGRIEVPMMAVAGERDSAAIARHSLGIIAGALPDATVAIAPGMHHNWNIENVELFNQTVREWIERRALAPGLRDFERPE
jgi:pimeloyl-ACP methyl ester carboxylesterase